MSKEIINCFYSHFKNTSKKLKIVCDWDEVIQCLEAFALYLALKKTKSTPFGLEKLRNVINQGYFRKKVYKLCSQIPAGKISTYKIIATVAYGSPNYARRVGTLLSRCPDCEPVSSNQNYNCPRIHCYRVIKSDFSIGGFLGETSQEHVKVTRKKLTSEGAVFDKKGYLAKELREKFLFKDKDFLNLKKVEKKVASFLNWEFEKQYFSPFFEIFWKNNLIDYSLYGSKLNKNFSEQAAQKNAPDFYSSAPFLSLAKELLMLVKEKKAEVIFLSAYDQRVFDNGDPRKKKIFAETFGKVPGCSLNLVGFSSEKTGQTKSEWIKKNVPNCDILLDDNPNILADTLKKNSKIIACSPYYPAIKHHNKVLLFKTSISNLKKEVFQ